MYEDQTEGCKQRLGRRLTPDFGFGGDPSELALGRPTSADKCAPLHVSLSEVRTALAGHSLDGS